jgi:pimeloyl-ACP methyl ester carboxylesterase
MNHAHLRLPGISLLLVILLTGCTNFLAQRMVAPPNGRSFNDASTSIPARLADNELRIPVGPPHALLAIWILEPKTSARGTILLLHGIGTDHHQVQGTAKVLQAAGYRSVMVDLRGHGKSVADHLTYGVDDARDLAQLTTYLQQHHLCGDCVGVFGKSYGASTAIMFAGADSRVSAVVAVAPFASLRQEAPYFAKHLLPIPGLFMSAADFDSVVNTMGQVAAFDPDAASPLAAIRKTDAHVRLFHGTWDFIVSCQSSQQLAAAAPDHAQLTLIPVIGHLLLCLDPLGQLRPETKAWFDRYLAAPPSR